MAKLIERKFTSFMNILIEFARREMISLNHEVWRLLGTGQEAEEQFPRHSFTHELMSQFYFSALDVKNNWSK